MSKNSDNSMFFEPSFAHLSPYVSEYFGLWMIYGPSLESLVNQHNGLNLHAHLQSDAVKQSLLASDNSQRDYMVTDDGIATFRVVGPTMKSASSMSGGTSTTRLRQQIRSAKNDAAIIGGLLYMDTPGGTVKGNADLADDIAAFSAVKPMYAFVEDMTASAGVSVASQARKRFANNATAVYGSMGTYAVLKDSSGAAEKLGLKVHVIKAGEHKGVGEPGSEVTEEHLAEAQRTVNAANDSYLGLIARGLSRSLSDIRNMADGKIILASDAVQMGLLNGIQTFEQTYQQLVTEAGKRQPLQKGRIPMNAATLAELKQAFPKSTADWRETQLEKSATISDAAMSYAAHVEEKAAARESEHAKELETAKQAAKANGNVSLGHQPLTGARKADADAYASQAGDAMQDFDAAVRSRLPKNRTPTLQERQQAIAFVARTNPGLHQAMLSQTNPGKTAQRQLEEKYEKASAN